jgi:hypothetical protein
MSTEEKKQIGESHQHKYIILRSLSGHTSEVWDTYDELVAEGYNYRLKDNQHGFRSVAGNCKGVVAKAADVEFLKGQALEQAKRDAGLPLAECSLVEHYVMIIPHGIDFPWAVEFKNIHRNKQQVLDALKGYTLGLTLPEEPPTMKNATWLQGLRDEQITLFSRYVHTLQQPTAEQTVEATALYEAYENKKASKKIKATKESKKTTEAVTTNKED